MDPRPAERLPLLSEHIGIPVNVAEVEHTKRSRQRHRFSPALLIVPVTVLCRLAIMLPSTTSFSILEMISCRLWYYWHDPASIPPTGQIPDELCSIPGVQEYYAAVVSIQAALGGIGSLSHRFIIQSTLIID